MTRTSVSAARLVFWAASLIAAVDAVWSLGSTVLRLLQEREPRLGFESYMRYVNVQHGALQGAYLVAEFLLAVGLVRLARAMTDGAEQRLLVAAAGAAAMATLGTACLWTNAMRAMLSARPIFTSSIFSVAHAVLAAAAIGAWLLASARLLRSFELTLPRALSVALAPCLAAIATLETAFALVRSPGPFLGSSTAVWAAAELDLFVSIGTAFVAWRLWQGLRSVEATGTSAKVEPYRVPEVPEQAAAEERARRAAFDAAQGVRLHTSAALAYAFAAVVGVALSAWSAGWHKFYADCAVRQCVGSLSLVALFAMVLTPTTGGAAEEGPGRLARGLTLTSLAFWGIVLFNLDRLVHYMNGNYGDGFYARLNDRDSLFRTTVSTQVVAHVAAIGALVAQAACYSRTATSIHDAPLARRASRLAVVVGVLALGPLAQLVLENSDSIDLALFAESTAKSPVIQGTLAVALISAAAFYRSVSGRLAAALLRVLDKVPLGAQRPRD